MGYDREDLASGRLRWTDLTPAEWLDRDLQQFVPELKTRGSLQPFEKEYFRKDGSRVPVLIGVAAIDKECDQGVAFVLDLTERKRADEERTRMLRAEAANRAKDEFLANVSHEIRTPMNAILGMTDLALDTPLAEDQRQYLKTVKSAADNLLGMINDLLDFSKIEAGKLELDVADFSLRAAVGDTLRALAVRAHRKGLELIYDVQPEVPDALVGDAGRLRQVLLNLVGNAIKFTDAGEVVVRVEVAGDPAPEGDVGLRFTVRDTGIGIPRDQQERIFRAFEQEDTSTTRKYGGTGLGLTIAARLVALMGGHDHRGERAGPGQHLRRSRRGSGSSRTPPSPSPPGRRSCSGASGSSWSTTTPPTATSWRSGSAAGRWTRPRSATAWRPWAPSGTPPVSANPTRWCCSTPACPTPTAWPWPPGSASERRCPPSGSSCSPRGTGRVTRHAPGSCGSTPTCSSPSCRTSCSRRSTG